MCCNALESPDGGVFVSDNLYIVLVTSDPRFDGGTLEIVEKRLYLSGTWRRPKSWYTMDGSIWGNSIREVRQ